MRLTSLPLLSAIAGVALADATWSAFVYNSNPTLETDQQLRWQMLSPATSRLVLAQRAGVEDFHIDRALNTDEIDAINTFGGRTPLLGSGEPLRNAFLLAFLESPTDLPYVRATTSFFRIVPVPDRTSTTHLILDLFTQSDLTHETPALHLDTPMTASNGDLYFVASSALALTKTYNELRRDASWHITALFINSSDSAGSTWGTYSMPNAESPLQPRQAKRQVLPYDPEEPLAEPSYHQSLSDNTSDPLQIFKSNNTKTRPLEGILPACFSSLSACQTTTRNCTGHGSCSLKYTDKDAGSGLGACYSCACQASVVMTDGKKKTTTWGGPACQKKDVSVEFWLIVLFTVGLIFVVGFAVGTVWEMGSEELPSVIGAGVSGPVKKS
nr:hypothetical protein B0A51_15680 [Rachicladosporium sp. CCFEE 5018]